MTEAAIPLLLSSVDAAGLLSVSESTFERHVAPHLPVVRIGTLVRYHREDLEAWLDAQKVGPSRAIGEPESTSSGSASPRVVGLTARRAHAIEQKLRGGRSGSSTKR